MLNNQRVNILEMEVTSYIIPPSHRGFVPASLAPGSSSCLVGLCPSSPIVVFHERLPKGGEQNG